jgi:hypothetical protein
MSKLKFIIFACLALSTFTVEAQKSLYNKKGKKNMFAKTDYKDYRFYGLQWSLGATYLMSKPKKIEYTSIDATNRPVIYTQDPYGLLGAYAEIGLAHFPKKSSKLAKILKTPLVDYYDWGLGFKLYGGGERNSHSPLDALGNKIYTDKGQGEFYLGYVYGRFAIHKNIHFSKKYFIDNELGANFNYRVLENKSHTLLNPGDRYQEKFSAQLHYGLGLGIHPNRRFTVIPSVQIPIFGIYQWRKGSAAIPWFSSNYVPLHVQVKFIYLFEKKVKGCAPARGDGEDEKRNDQFMQGQ